MLSYAYFWGAEDGKGTPLVRSSLESFRLIIRYVWVTLVCRPKLLTGFLIILWPGRVEIWECN